MALGAGPPPRWQFRLRRRDCSIATLLRGAPQRSVTGYLPPSPQESWNKCRTGSFSSEIGHRADWQKRRKKEKEGDLRSHKQLVLANDEIWRMLNGHGRVPTLSQQVRTTYQTTVCEMLFPQTLPALATARNILPTSATLSDW